MIQSIRLHSAIPAELWLLSALLLIFIPHLIFQPIYISAAAFAFLLWRALFVMRILKLPSRFFRTIIALLTFTAIITSHQSVLGRNAGVSLLIVMLGLKLLEMQSDRDMFITMCLGYFVAVTGFLYSQSVFLGLYTLGVVFLLTGALISHNHNAKGRHATAHGRLAVGIVLQAVPLAIMLFFFFPRISGPLWSIDDPQQSGKTGLSEMMSPGQISELSLDNSVAFRAEFNSNIPPLEKLYWRGPVFTYFDGISWQNLMTDKKPLFENKQQDEAVPLNYINRRTVVRYTLTLEPHQRRWLFALDLPVSLPKATYLTGNYELVSSKPMRNVARYDLVSETESTAAANQFPPQRIYTQLPAQAGLRARQLAEQLYASVTQTDRADLNYVHLVLRYFRDNAFFYTRNPPIMIKDSIDQFLFEAQRGFCEHYASAFAVLMRAAGIPARIVTGYHGGTFNSVGNYLIVRQSDAHAWAEVWLHNQGWVRFDPTAVIPPERIVQTEIRERRAIENKFTTVDTSWLIVIKNQLTQGWDNVNYLWNQWVIGFNVDKQHAMLDSLGLQGIAWQELAKLLFAGLGLLILSLVLFLVRDWKIPERRIDVAYRRFCAKLDKIGIQPRDHEGIVTLGERVAEHFPQLRQQTHIIAQLYNRVRYAKNPPRRSLSAFEQAVKQFKPINIKADKHAAAK